MNGIEFNAFVKVVNFFSGNHNPENSTELMENMFSNFNALDFNMSIKVYYINDHLDRCPENLVYLKSSATLKL